MPHVNHGVTPTNDYSQVNCALCTVAAIFDTDSAQIAHMLGIGHVQAAGAFSYTFRRKYRIPSPGPLASVELAMDFEGIKEFVAKLKRHIGAPVHVSQGGSWTSLVPMAVQERLMLSYPVGTQYAVWACTDIMAGHGAHWNYAVRTMHGVEFRDYQYDIADGVGPRVSDHFIPPQGNDDANYNRGVVLVFRSTATPLV